jgi:hypothetical protein
MPLCDGRTEIIYDFRSACAKRYNVCSVDQAAHYNFVIRTRTF